MDSKRVALIDAGIASIKQSSVVTLAAHGAINADQVAAAFHFRNAFLIEIDAKRQSIGFNEWQAPGPPSGEIVSKRLQASKDLKAARALLGSHGFMLVGKICGEGYHINDLYGARRERDTMTDMLKIHLTSLAKLWRL